jgi:hypothetical protein
LKHLEGSSGDGGGEKPKKREGNKREEKRKIEGEEKEEREGERTLSLSMGILSNDCLEATEYTITYPCTPKP